MSHEHEWASRTVELEGCHNFRDLGGLPTADGRRVRRGRVYRSDSLVNLTASDQARVTALGIRLLYDLRSVSERGLRPVQYTGADGIEIRGGNDDHDRADLDAVIANEQATDTSFRDFMLQTYRETPYRKQEVYQRLFRSMATDPSPLVFFCAWGKDRTGIAAALLLDVLGVPRDEIIADYVLSKAATRRGFERLIANPASRFARLRGVDPEIWGPLADADPRYLGAMFEQVEARHGSVTGFCREVLGTDGAWLERLRAALVA